MRTDNTKADEIAALVRRIEKLERQAPAGFTSITRGALRVASPEGLIVEGSENVTGTLTISGTLNGDGTITWTGTMTNNGQTNLNGPTDINGTLDVSGLVTLMNSLVLQGGGKIDIGGVEMSGGVISGTTVQINGESVILLVGPTQVLGTLLVSQLATLSSLAVQNDASIGGTLKNPGIVSKAGVTANVYVDSSGRFWKLP